MIKLGLRHPRKTERQILGNNDHSNSSIHYQHTNTSPWNKNSCFQGPMRECLRARRVRASLSLQTNCARPVVIRALAVWWQNNNKKFCFQACFLCLGVVPSRNHESQHLEPRTWLGFQTQVYSNPNPEKWYNDMTKSSHLYQNAWKNVTILEVLEKTCRNQAASKSNRT